MFGLLGLFLTQNAFHAGPLAASQSTLVLVDPLASISIGIALYGDRLRTSGPYGPARGALTAGHVRRRGLPLQLAADHRHEERGQGRGVRRDALAPAEAPAPPRTIPSGTAGGCRRSRRPDQVGRTVAGPLHHERAPWSAKWSGCDRCAPCCASAISIDDRTRDVGAQPFHGPPVVVRPTVGPPRPKTAGRVERHDVEGRDLLPHAAQVGDERRPVGPPAGPRVIGQPGPGVLADHAAEEALGLVSGIVGHRWPPGPARPVAPETQPGHGRLEGPDGRRRLRATASAAPSTTSPPRLWPTATTGPPVGVRPRRRRDGEQVVDVAAQVHDPAVPGTLVAPAVVRHGGELGEPAHGPPEAVAPVERAVDEDHRCRTRGRGRPFDDVECGRIGHGQGRRYLACP